MNVAAITRVLRRPPVLAGIVALIAITLAIATVVGRDSGTSGSSAPTVPIPGTPANIGCLEETGTVTAAADTWYDPEAGGSLKITGEIVASVGLGAFSKAATDAVVAQMGTIETSAVRDIAPVVGACATVRFAGYQVNGGAEIQVMTWRLIAAASPTWLPNEGPFEWADDTTLVSVGEHAITVLMVEPDGTTVMAATYGVDALEALSGGTVATGPGRAPATVDQLTAIATAVMQG